jgi:hypothetical protein
MMNKITTRYYKPDLLILLLVFTGFGVFAASVVHAAEPLNSVSLQNYSSTNIESERWYQSLWGIDLARKLHEWKPKITVEEGDEGLRLSRPFGVRGPALRLSDAMPESAMRSLRGGRNEQDAAFNSEMPDVYLFLEKRW